MTWSRSIEAVIAKYQTVKDGICRNLTLTVYRFELNEINIVWSHHTATSLHRQSEMVRPVTVTSTLRRCECLNAIVQLFHHYHHHHHHRHHHAASSLCSMKSSL
uniref:Uncharacterized protein n=1 Tax=Glossina palpalis gambiensis TaxID=67801 RepID=A0A1B0B8T0_9MUSC